MPRPRGQRVVGPQITLSEANGVRYLHFGTEWVQGAMRLARPYALVLEYQQQMMAPLLFLPRPRRILQLGLGAAALAKFCWRALPRAHVTAVEISDAVVTVARRWFRLPTDDRLQVVVADAREFLTTAGRTFAADWLQVDLYDAAARGPVYDDVAFYRACRAALAERGVAAINLFGSRFDCSFDAIARAFDGRVLALAEADAGNRVVLAFTGPRRVIRYEALDARARALQGDFGLPARRWIGGLRAGADGDAMVRI
ncbi:MAG: spermidine synthase [Sutterellaceae bacterium]|nr:spermidine synthase [Burkholderiaceae bacterium]MCX7900759.1 spermidine synthase [Burkholderiaceae bacterium]MDW8430398.1 spermidine synthase [Sutterellaceae bacterium]